MGSKSSFERWGGLRFSFNFELQQFLDSIEAFLWSSKPEPLARPVPLMFPAHGGDQREVQPVAGSWLAGSLRLLRDGEPAQHGRRRAGGLKLVRRTKRR